jgi:hypothetical protein
MTNKIEEFKVGAIGDKTITTEDLPKPLRESIKFYNRLTEKLQESADMYQTILIALTTTKGKIQHDIAEYLKENNLLAENSEENSDGE